MSLDGHVSRLKIPEPTLKTYQVLEEIFRKTQGEKKEDLPCEYYQAVNSKEGTCFFTYETVTLSKCTKQKDCERYQDRMMRDSN